MILGIAFALAAAQGPSDEVGKLVGDGQYSDALRVALEAPAEESVVLEVWTRHHAGDLAGALERAQEGLEEMPDHKGLLEQAAYLSASLYRGTESLNFAERLTQLGDPRGAALAEEARTLLDIEDDVGRGRAIARALLLAFSLVACALGWWGMRPAKA